MPPDKMDQAFDFDSKPRRHIGWQASPECERLASLPLAQCHCSSDEQDTVS